MEVLVAKLQKLSTEGKQLSPYEVACIASYRSLSIYDWLPRTAPHKDLEALFKGTDYRSGTGSRIKKRYSNVTLYSKRGVT